MNLLFIIGILVLARSVNSHHCYVCKLGNCTEPFPVNSQHKHVDCNKIKQEKTHDQTHPYSTGCMKKLIEIDGVKNYERDCYFGNYHQTSGCMDFVTYIDNGDILSCDICTNDLCNQSTEINVTSVGVVMAALIARYLIF